MAKRKLVNLYYVNGDSRVLLSPKFIYEVEIYINKQNQFYLADTVIESVAEPKKKIVENRKVNNYRETLISFLVGAPKEWLDENGYTME